MTQYFYIDESGDAELQGQASSSSHFVIAMVQLPDRAPLRPLINLRKALNTSAGFEFKYHKTTAVQKECFFKDILGIQFRVRAVILDKARIGMMFNKLSPQELTIELDIANEILIIDGATTMFCRNLRVQFTEWCKREKRIRPFKNIIGADSRNEDGLQVADMVAGAIRLTCAGHVKRAFSAYFPADC